MTLKSIRVSRLCIFLVACSLSAQQAKLHLYRVDDNIFRGKQPTRGEISQLSANGIKTVLDLRGTIDHKRWEQKAVQRAGMRYIRIGLSPFFPPSEQRMNRILAILEDPSLGPIYIHCRRGADRSGMVVACYRMAHDHWTNAQAMEEAREHHFWGIEVLMHRYIEHYHPPAQAAQDASR